MRLYFRLFWLIITARWKPACGALDTVETQVRVWPNDLDLFMHVNNGVYLTYGDLGRTDLLLRTGVVGSLRRKRWYPVAARAYVEYRKSLKLWQKVTIKTRIIGWDDKSVYLEQIFTHGDSLVARLFIDGRFLSFSGERITPAQTLDLFDMQGMESPELSGLPWQDEVR